MKEKNTALAPLRRWLAVAAVGLILLFSLLSRQIKCISYENGLRFNRLHIVIPGNLGGCHCRYILLYRNLPLCRTSLSSLQEHSHQPGKQQKQKQQKANGFLFLTHKSAKPCSFTDSICLFVPVLFSCCQFSPALSAHKIKAHPLHENRGDPGSRIRDEQKVQ